MNTMSIVMSDLHRRHCLFTARSVDNGVAGFPQPIGHAASHQKVVLNNEDDQCLVAIPCYTHDATSGPRIGLGAEKKLFLWSKALLGSVLAKRLTSSTMSRPYGSVQFEEFIAAYHFNGYKPPKGVVFLAACNDLLGAGD